LFKTFTKVENKHETTKLFSGKSKNYSKIFQKLNPFLIFVTIPKEHNVAVGRTFLINVSV
jgi:hypothetical protein